MSANVDLQNPLLWALLIGWIMTVVLHEFAHGLVASLGGDYTIRERGGLTLNPLHYIDPLMSIILPAVFLMMGGIPLPGGATYIRRDLLRSKAWESAVSAAGPAMNFLVFLLLCIPLQPRFHWVNYSYSNLPAEWGNAQLFVSGLAVTQLFAIILNLFPIPPLDGFGIIAPYLPPELHLRLTRGPLGTMLFFGFFLLAWNSRPFGNAIFTAMGHIFALVGLPERYNEFFLYRGGAFQICLYGRNIH